MNPIRRQRLILISLIFICFATAVGFALYALSQNINLFYSPSQVVEGKAPTARTIRLGGLVETGTIKHNLHSLQVSFDVTDRAKSVRVTYKGILPDLFREGQSVVVEGRLNNKGVFQASQVLAKHDAKYMPKNVREALAAAKKEK